MNTNLGPISIDNLVPAAIDYELARTKNNNDGITREGTDREIELLVYVFRIALAEMDMHWRHDLLPPDVMKAIRLTSGLVERPSEPSRHCVTPTPWSTGDC